MARNRTQAWVIAEQDDLYSIWHGRKQIVTGLQSFKSAKTIVDDNRAPGERVWSEDSEGYRIDLTASYRQQDRTATRQMLVEKAAALTPGPDDPHPVRTRYLARYGRPRPVQLHRRRTDHS